MRTNTLSFAEKPTLEEIAGALHCIPSQLAYGDWLKICAAVHAAYPGEDGVNVVEQWSPGYDGEVAEKFKSFNGTNRSTVATLFHFAKQHGWTKGSTSPVTYNKVTYKPAAPTTSAGWDEPAQRQKVMESHVNLVTAGTRYAWQCMEYLQKRGITSDTIKAFGIGYTVVYPPGAFEFATKKQSYPKQLALSLPWFNHDGALVAVKYRFVEQHTYTDVHGNLRDGKDGKGVRFTSKGTIKGNVFGWQTLRGPDHVDMLIVCEGEINGLSLWQAGHHAADVLSMGSESGEKLPQSVVNMAKGYKHKIVWADKKDVADAAALQIGAASMGSPNGMDANDLLQAGQLGAWFEYAFKRLGLTFPAMPSVTAPVTSHQSPVTDRIDDLLSIGDAVGILFDEEKAQPLRPVDTLLIDDALPFDFDFGTEPAPAVNKVAAMAEQLRQVAELGSFDERLDALEPLHAAFGTLSYAESREPSILQLLQSIFKKQSKVDAFLSRYGAKLPEPAPEKLVIVGDQPEVVALDVATDDLQLFVGRIVSDDDMERLYYRAHMEGARLTSDWRGKRLPCEHKVTSYRAGGVK